VGHAAGHELVEARLVADLLDQVGTGHGEPDAARKVELEDRPVLLCHGQSVLDRMSASMSKALPTNGKPCGPGISSRAMGVLTGAPLR
jgi:hypothetical protein